jgi:hypothetical protein
MVGTCLLAGGILMNTKIFLVLPAIIIVVGLFIISFQPNTQSAVGSGTMVMDSNIPAQEPPGFSPSRNKEGGPAGRRSWETMRLANPATGRIPPDIHRREQEFARRLPSRGSSALMEAAGLDPGAKMGGWGFRGPDNIGGRTRALAIDVSDPGYQTLLAGGVSGGMWRSVDDGNSWELTTGSSQLHSVTTLAQDTRPGHENVWYYGTGEANWNSASHYNAYYAGDGVFKSTDNGQTWALLPSTSGFPPSNFYSFWQYVWRVAVDPSNQVEDEIYAAIFGKIMRSVDGGATFDQVLGDTSSPYSPYTDVVVSSTGVVYASISSEGSTTGIFRSPDGINWTNITPTNLTTHSRIVLAVAPSNEIILYATVANVYGSINEGLFRYIYVSGDGSGTGGFWEDRSLALGLMPLPSGGTGPMEYYGGYSMQLTVNPTNPNNLYLGGVHLYRDIGAGYQRIGGAEYPVHHADLHLLVFQPGSSSIAYSGSDGGVHKTLDIDGPSVDWVSLNNSYNTSQFYTVAIDENLEGSDIIVGGMQDNGTCITTTQDPADPWLETLSGDGSYCAVADASGAVGTYLQSFQNGYLYRVEVDNTTGARTFWGQITPTDAGDYLFINPFIIDPNDTKIVYLATSNGVWRNNDLYNTPAGSPTMTNWDHLTTEPAGDHVTALAMSRSANRVLFRPRWSWTWASISHPAAALPTSPSIPMTIRKSCWASRIMRWSACSTQKTVG